MDSKCVSEKGGAKMAKKYKQLSKRAWLSIGALLVTQAVGLFLSARKSGRNPWVWGGAGLVQFPLPAIAYLILERQAKQKK